MEPIKEINIPEIEEKPQKNNKKVLVTVLSCIAVLAIMAAVGIFIVRAYYSDERKLIKGLQKLAEEINERRQLWEEASGSVMTENAFEGNAAVGNESAENESAYGLGAMKMITSLNLSGDDLPITLGVDTMLLRDISAHRMRTSTALSVMNNELIGLVIYGDDDKLMLSVPDLWRQNLEFAPERIDRQYNDSLLAEKFGSIESSEVSVDLFPEKDSVSLSGKFKRNFEDSAVKISIEKLEGPIMTGVSDKDGKLYDDRKYECSPYNVTIPKEWFVGVKADDGATVDMQTADAAAAIMQDVELLIYMGKNSRIIGIALKEPLQFSVKYGDYEEIAEIRGSAYFLGEGRSIDDIVVNMEAEITMDSLNPERKELSGGGNNFTGEEKMGLQLKTEIGYDKDDTRITMDVDELTIYIDDGAAFRVTGEIGIEPLREEILPLDGETIQLFKITEDEYEDLKSQLQKKLLKWITLFSIMK